MSARPMSEIPVSAAKHIADRYGYDQVVIIARRVGDEPEPHGEHVTTYGRDKAHCGVAARVGNFIKHKIMRWPEYESAPQAAPAAVAPEGDHDALRCAVGNCTFNGEVTQHVATCPNKPSAVAGPVAWISQETLDALAMHRRNNFPAGGHVLAMSCGSATVALHLHSAPAPTARAQAQQGGAA